MLTILCKWSPQIWTILSSTTTMQNSSQHWRKCLIMKLAQMRTNYGYTNSDPGVGLGWVKHSSTSSRQAPNPGFLVWTVIAPSSQLSHIVHETHMVHMYWNSHPHTSHIAHYISVSLILHQILTRCFVLWGWISGAYESLLGAIQNKM